MNTHSPALRILDANANRAREALRVLEDIARFALNDQPLCTQLKNLRHDFAAALAKLPMNAALLARDTPGDVGTAIKTQAEFRRADTSEILAANAKRLSEALRSMEEAAKTIDPAAAGMLEQLRYRGYTIEQSLSAGVRLRSARDRFAAVRLYVLLTNALCAGSGACPPWESTLGAILDAASTRSQQLCIQLREKDLPDSELLLRATAISRKCRQAGALFIMNDRPDIALLSKADGIHLGQTDLPCAAARSLLGPDAIIGISTERLEQARQAAADGATYIAVGPMFHTTTKDKPRIAGPAYAAEAAAALKEEGTPIVAIGGITLENVGEVMAAGVQAVAVSAAVLRAQDPADATRRFLDRLGDGR